MQHLTLEQLRLTHSDKKPAAPPAGSPAPAPASREGQTKPNFKKGAPALAEADYATPENHKLLRTMIAERDGAEATAKVREFINSALNDDPTRRLSKQQFRKAFQDLKAITRTDKPSQTTSGTRGFTPRPNKFPGNCAECNRRIDIGEGLLIGKDDHGDWAVSHKPGECVPSEYPFPLGKYAVEIDGVMKFYVFDEDGIFAQASDDLHEITNAEYAKQVIGLIAEDPLEASKRYGREKKQCGRCGRSLTSGWRKVGIGPVCSQKGW